MNSILHFNPEINLLTGTQNFNIMLLGSGRPTPRLIAGNGRWDGDSTTHSYLWDRVHHWLASLKFRHTVPLLTNHQSSKLSIAMLDVSPNYIWTHRVEMWQGNNGDIGQRSVERSDTLLLGDQPSDRSVDLWILYIRYINQVDWESIFEHIFRNLKYLKQSSPL